jgi:hypothetical protein
VQARRKRLNENENEAPVRSRSQSENVARRSSLPSVCMELAGWENQIALTQSAVWEVIYDTRS